MSELSEFLKTVPFDVGAHYVGREGDTFKWKVSIDGEQFEFGQGLAYVRPRRGLVADPPDNRNNVYIRSLLGHRVDRNVRVGSEEYYGFFEPSPPDVAGVISCLISDYDACEQSFSDWCSNFDISMDSRKGLATYLACQDNGSKLLKLLRKRNLGLEQLRNLEH